MSFGRTTSLVASVRAHAERDGGRRALTFLEDGESRERVVDWRELEAKSRDFAEVLSLSCGSGERALLLLPTGFDYAAAFVGALRAGVVAVPLFPPKLNRSLERVRAIARDCTPRAVIVERSIAELRARVIELAPELAAVAWIVVDELPSARGAWDQRDPRGDELAFLQYTSGSTGSPKGVMVAHDNLAHNAELMARAWRHERDSVLVSWLPLFHDMGLIGKLVQSLFVGCECVLMQPAHFLARPLRWLEAITRYRGTTSGAPNFAFDLVLERATDEALRSLDLSSWRIAYNGAEPVRAETLERFTARFAACGLRADAVRSAYGLAEATLLTSSSDPARGNLRLDVSKLALARGRVAEPSDGDRVALVSCGAPHGDMRAAIVDPQTSQRCADGELGEIWLQGPSIARGYWNQRDASDRTFRAWIAGELGAWMRTGDLGFERGGELFVAGRAKDVIILRGQNHYPQDLELTVERSHAEFRAAGCAAFGVELDGREHLVVVQELERRRSSDVAAAFASVRRALVEEHEVEPHAIVLVGPGGVSKTSSGKVQRSAVRAQWLAGELDVVAQWSASSPDHAPIAVPDERDAEAIERWLVELGSRALEMPAGAIDASASFAALGFDSLRMSSLAFRVERELGRALPLARLFEGASLRTVARDLANAAPLAASARPQPARASLPLSFGQRALWFLHRVAPESSAYNAAVALAFDTALDATALQRAIDLLVERHAALRTTYADADAGEPRQDVHARMDAPLELQRDAAHAVERFVREPFALDRRAPLRVAWFARERGGVLAIAAHHVAVDQASLTTMLGELSALYADEHARLDDPRGSYAEFVDVEASRAGDEAAWSYWRAKLSDELPALSIASDRPRAPRASLRCGTLRASIDGDDARALREFAAAHDATAFAVALAAFECVLHRCTGETRFALGTLTAGRTCERFDRTVGYFVQPLVLAADFSGDPTVAELLERVRRDVAGSLAHASTPFAALVERLHPAREAGRTPFFDVLFAWQHTVEVGGRDWTALALNHSGARVDFAGVEAESLAIDAGAPQFDLALTMGELRRELRFGIALEYDAELYDAATAQRLLDRFVRALREFVRRPLGRAAELAIESESELRRELAFARGTSAPIARSVVELFEARVRLAPEALAVDGLGARWTYAELDSRARSLAQRLHELGARPEVVVAVHLDRTPERVAALLATSLTGAAWMPLDPALPDARVDWILRDARASIVVTSGRADRPPFERCAVVDVAELAPRTTAFESRAADPASLAYVIYTSGSTGTPKGVAISHASLANHAASFARVYDYRAGDRVAQIAAVGFDQSVEEIFPPLAAGATLVFGTREERAELVDWVRARSITVLDLVTGFWSSWVESLSARPRALPSSLRLVGLGGEKASASVLARWLALGGAGVRWINTYGPTETSVVSATFAPSAELGASWGARDIPIGRAEPNQSVYVLAPGWTLQSPGAPGEIAIGGAGVARGYVAQPARTAAAFVPDPFSGEPGARMYLTGDRGARLENGDLAYLGRADDQLKIRGHRVEPREVEEVLRAHADLAAVAVVARSGPSGAELAAFCVPIAGARVDAERLRAFLAERVPPFLVPARFVELAELPLNAHGKLDRKALRAARIDESAREVADEPRTEAERALARVWCEVLALDAVARSDDFFARGGDSIRSLQVVARAARAGWELRPDQLFRHPTLAELAAVAVKAAAPAPRAKPAAPALDARERDKIAALLAEADARGAP